MATPGPDGSQEPSPVRGHYRSNRRSKASSNDDGSGEFRGYAARFRRSCRCSGGNARPTAEGRRKSRSRLSQRPRSRNSPANSGSSSASRTNSPSAASSAARAIHSFAPMAARSATPAPSAGCTGWRCRRPIATCAIRPIPTRICRPSASMPQAGCNTATMPIGKRCASSARRIGWPNWSPRSQKSAATFPCICRATSRRANSRCRP